MLARQNCLQSLREQAAEGGYDEVINVRPLETAHYPLSPIRKIRINSSKFSPTEPQSNTRNQPVLAGLQLLLVA